MRKIALIFPVLILILGFSPVFGQSPTELIGPFISENPGFLIAIIVGAVSYIGLSRLGYQWQSYAAPLAFVIFFVTFLSLTFVEPIKFGFEGFYNPIDVGFQSNFGFELLPMIGIAAALIIVALFLLKLGGGDTSRQGLMGNWKLLSFFAGILLIIFSVIINEFLNIPQLHYAMLAIGGLLILAGIFGSIWSGVTKLGGDGGSDTARKVLSAMNPFKDKFSIWACVVKIDPNNSDHKTWASNPQRESYRRNLLTLPRVKDAQVRARNLTGKISHRRKFGSWLRGRKTNEEGMTRFRIEGGREYDVHVWEGKVEMGGNWVDITPTPNFRRIYNVTSDMDRPQIVIPLGAPPSGPSISTDKQDLLDKIERIRVLFENFRNKPSSQVDIPLPARNYIDNILTAIQNNVPALSANASYSNADPDPTRQDKTYMTPIWKTIMDFYQLLGGIYFPNPSPQRNNISSGLDIGTWDSTMIPIIDNDSQINNLISRMNEIGNRTQNTLNNLEVFWSPVWGSYPPAYQALVANLVNFLGGVI